MADRDVRPDRPIALVGLMGAGKSSVGRRLARRLAIPFVDSDEEVERASGFTVSDIFERFGEPAFRDCERRVAARLAAGPVRVIATGGGLFADPAARGLLLERCITIWLEADLDLLAERVARRGGRPLLEGRDPREALASLAAARDPFYAEAHIRVRSTGGSHEALVDQILDAMGRFLRPAESSAS